ncbi:MAG: hypothetical protein GY858_02320 [Candidatus Omnitrophica bacterium]|nr:hypothetical protein [Candidatus Omnitrophota bacterium]
MLEKYKQYFKESEKEWEDRCIRCGGCCGAFDDPCLQLRKDNQGKYYCVSYQDRFGEQLTKEGEKFDCVPIWKIYNSYWKNDHLCAYKRTRKLPWKK